MAIDIPWHEEVVQFLKPSTEANWNGMPMERNALDGVTYQVFETYRGIVTIRTMDWIAYC